MSPLTGARVGLALALVLLVAAPPAASADLPVGEAEGVRIVKERGAIVVVFTQRAEPLRKRVAGKFVSVHCTELLPDGAHSGGATQRAPKRGRRIRTGDKTRGMDYCRVSLAPRTVKRDGERRRLGRQLVVSIPLTQKGAVYLDEESKTGDMIGVLVIAGIYAQEAKPEAYPTPTQLIAAIEKETGRVPRDIVALATPAATPPAGKVGYYSDGQEHIAAVVLSASGRRLFFEAAADEVLHTNVARYIFGDPFL